MDIWGKNIPERWNHVEKAFLGNSECGLFEEQQRGLVGAVNEVVSRQRAAKLWKESCLGLFLIPV